jgi:hypothetical protein
MKKLPILLVMLLAGVLGLTSCEKGAQLYEVSISVFYPDGYDVSNATNVNVVVKNTLSGQEVNLITNHWSAVTSLEEGMYTISAAQKQVIITLMVSPRILQSRLVLQTIGRYTW